MSHLAIDHHRSMRSGPSENQEGKGVKVLDILLLEDSPLDAELILATLAEGGIDCRTTTVQTRKDYLAALERGGHDLILADYSLPSFDGITALEIAQRQCPEVPFLFVSGALGEELAIETLKRGATDYVLKHRLERLIPSVLRALREAEARAERKRAEESLRFLAEASTLLASSLDYEATLGRMAQLAIASMADWCIVDMVEDDRSIRRLIVSHADPSRLDQARALRCLGPSDPDGPTPMAAVLRTGRPVVIPEITEAMLGELIPEGGRRSIARSLGIASLMVVPLSSRGATLGAVALVSSDGAARRYGPGELALAEELARRAGVAIDNARLHQATQDACRVAEAASQAKDRFLAMLSHELRTPLAPILLTVDTLLDDPEVSGSVRPQLEMIRRNVELEASLIEDLLDVTRIVQGKLTLKREVVDAHALIHQALAICRAEIDAAGIDLDLSLDAGSDHIEGDPARLQQVFWNLIKNAVKFTPSGGTLTLRTRNDPPHEPDGLPRLVVTVSDTGIGIAPDVLPRIFDSFEQGGESVTRRFGGLGLGLAISRSIVELHSGSLVAESAGLNQGATFTIDLASVPTPPPDSVPTGSEDGEPSHRRSLRVLFVEDHEDTARVMVRLLEKSGHAVTATTSLAAALEAAQGHRFDLVISDLDLPDGSGLDLMRQLRRIQPIVGIALSGFGMEEDLRKSREAGFSEHLTKPVNYQRLEAGLQRLARTIAPCHEGESAPAGS